MLQRFEGKKGRRLRMDALRAQKIVGGNAELAEELADRVTLRALPKGGMLIEQGADDKDLFFLVTGSPRPRDSVIFELGLFMGRLGRAHALLMEPREDRGKLPSDLSGITTITYRFEKRGDAAALSAPACNTLRDRILMLGPNNG